MSAQSDRFRVLRRLTEIRFEDELRGYSKNQVDRVLETLAPLAADVEQLQLKLAEAERRAASAEARLLENTDGGASQDLLTPAPGANEPPPDFDETLRKTLLLAQRTADTVVREANEQAEETRSKAAEEAERLAQASRFEADRLVAEGEAARSAMVAEVEGERGALLADARAKATAQIAEIEAELATVHESQREELLDQISELQQIRDLLADDIENFEAYLAERRETVRAAMSEINVVLDDPARIRPSMPPQASSIAPIDPGAYQPIKVELESLRAIEPQKVPAIDEPERDTVSILDSEDVADARLLDVLSSATEDEPTSAQVEPVVGQTDSDGTAVERRESLTQQTDVVTESVAEAETSVEVETPSDADSIPAPAVEPEPAPVGAVTEAVEVVPGVAGIDLTEADPAVADVAGTEVAAVDLAGTDDPEVLIDVERPAWADSVPEGDATGSTDPFLDELRKATSGSKKNDEAMDRFLNDEMEEPSRGGWFGRRR